MSERNAVLGLFIAALVNAPCAWATTIDLGTFLVSPQGSFLYQSASNTCAVSDASCNNAPTFINLEQYIGDTITITDVGSLCLYSAPEQQQSNCTMYPASANYLGGVFDTNTILLGPSNLDRLPGAVSSGLPNINSPSLDPEGTTISTTIPDDFYLPATVVVPAQWLVVGTLDSAYSDNSGTTPPTFGVDITVNTGDADAGNVPEPGAAFLLLTGLTLLWGFRRKITKS